MQSQNSIFKKWVPERLLLPILIFAIFPHIMLFSIFTMNTTFTASFLDVDVDDLQFMFSTVYAMIVCGMFLHVRLFHFFNVRSYLLFMAIANIIVLFVMTCTNNFQVILALRYIQGPLVLFEGVILVPVIMNLLKTPNARLIAFSVLYFFMLTGDKFSTSLIKFAIENYNHNMILYTIILFHVVLLIIYATILNHNRLFPKKPLYQLNLGGIFLMSICLISGAYFLIYGKRLYWFESPTITLAFTLCLVFGAFFIVHQKYAKRPLFHFEVFRSRRIVIGIGLFFFYYIIRASMGNFYQVMGQVWKWPWEYILKIQYFNVAGSFIGVLIGYQLLARKVNFKYIFFLGFILLASSMLYFSLLLVPDARVGAVVPSLVVEGVGQGILFCPLVMFMVGSVHPTISGSASQSGTAIRFWTNTIGFSIMQNSVLYLTTKHQFLMTKNLDVTSTLFQNEWNQLFGKFDASHLTNDTINLTVSSIRSKLYNQAFLVSSMEIYRTLFVMALLVSCFILIYPLIRNRFRISN